MSAIRIEHLKKNYGKHIGVKDVSFTVEYGEVFGFVGPNGAGKSTTIKTLMGFIRADGGKSQICDLDVVKDSKKIKTFTGYVPSDVRLYSDMKVEELLRRSDSFYHGDHSDEIRRLCDLFEIAAGKRFSELSTGNKKKVSIICALAVNPKIIILDEPTSGLDPVMQKRLFGELKSRTENGCAVLLSSHNLAEVQEYCDRAAFIKSGSILAVTDLKENTLQTKIVTLTGGNPSVSEKFELLSEKDNKRIFRTQQIGKELITILNDLSPEDFNVENESIEERFWSIYGKGDAE